MPVENPFPKYIHINVTLKEIYSKENSKYTVEHQSAIQDDSIDKYKK